MLEVVSVDGVVMATVRPDQGSLNVGSLHRSPSAETSVAAIAVLNQRHGWTLRTTDEELANSLLAHGARLIRNSLLMVHHLGSHVAAPTTTDVIPLSSVATRLVAAYTAAYPPGHLDHVPAECDPTQAELTLASYLRGEVVGPLIACASFEALGSGGEVTGAIIVSQMPGDDEYEGSPWVTELFVHPDHHGHGIGRALVGASLNVLASNGEAQLGLAVSVGNPAEHLYHSLGFTSRLRTWTLAIPPRAEGE